MKAITGEEILRNPIKLAIAVMAMLVVGQLMFFLIKFATPKLLGGHGAWVVSIAMLLLFVLFNAISTFLDDNIARNWGRSIYGFILLCGVGYLLSWCISGKMHYEVVGFHDMVLIVIIGFLVLKSIATSIKGIVLYTQYQDSLKK